MSPVPRASAMTAFPNRLQNEGLMAEWAAGSQSLFLKEIEGKFTSCILSASHLKKF